MRFLKVLFLLIGTFFFIVACGGSGSSGGSSSNNGGDNGGVSGVWKITKYETDNNNDGTIDEVLTVTYDANGNRMNYPAASSGVS